MPASRRYSRTPTDIWPGFVDALSTLLLVFIFLLVVFVLGQFFLSQLLEGRDEAVERLESELEDLEASIAVERQTSDDLRQALNRVADELRIAEVARSDLEGDLRELETDRDLVNQRLQISQTAERERETELETIRSERDAIETRLATRQQELEAVVSTTLDLERALEAGALERRLALAEVDRLQGLVRTLSEQLTQLDQSLEQKQGEIDTQNAVIEDLGERLNVALAERVEELSQYRSEFFGRLRQLLGEQEDIEIVGDRFVVQSEVLFDSGEADLEPQGRQELAKLADTLRLLIGDIPEELDWVIQVDGHTDKRPISTAQFPSNWELSTARAIEVARFLTSQGIPPERVAARGFAEFHPLDDRETEEAFRRNRRIELKLTTR